MDIWRRFKQVTLHVPENRRLFRASAPNYSGRDDSQNLTADAVKFLTDRGIDGIVSFNHNPYSDAEKALLREASIEYLHIPLPDFTAPTVDNLCTVYNFFMARTGGTLIHCGFGHGRTGTGVTGVQLHVTRGVEPNQRLWALDNHVERAEQMTVLRSLRDAFGTHTHLDH